MKIESFKEIESWQKARELVKEIYQMTNNGSFSKDYGLKDQIQRASVSIMSNIAEGFDSGSRKSFIRFLNYSYGSASEVESLLFVALDLNYITKKEFERISEKIKVIKNLIGGFIQYLKRTKDHEQRTKHKNKKL